MFKSMMKWSVGLTAVGCVLVMAAAAGADFEYSATRTEGDSLFPGGCTRVVVADDGTWLMVRRCKADGSGVTNHAGQVFLAHSDDHGETWTDDGKISNDEHDAINAEFIKYPNGDIEIFYTRYDNSANTFHTPNMVNRLTYNGTYAGSTWSGFRPAVGPLNEPSSIMWQEVNVGDTTYLGRYGRYSGPTFSKTTDNGLTWTDVSHIDPEAPPGYHSEYGEPGLIHLGNGEFLAVLRGCGDYHDGSSTQGLTLQKRSTDWGQTWTLDGYIKSDGSVNPDKNAGTNVRLDQCRMWTEDIDGNDLGYIYMQANLYPGHYPRNMYAYFSTDGGASWGFRSLLETGAHDSALVLKSSSSAKYYPGRMLHEGNITCDDIDIVTPLPIPGDANFDNVVNDEDASILAANWQQTGMGWGDGDFNDDGIVNGEDASIMAAHWLESRESGAPVPEPSVPALLLGMGLFGFLAHARRRTPDFPQWKKEIAMPMAIRVLLAWLFLCSAASAAKFTIVCSDAGTGGYEAFPDVCRTKSGELLCVFYAGYGHGSPPNEQLPRGGRIAMCRSIDDGKTWSPATIVADTPLDDRDPSIIELPGGDLLVTFMTCDNRLEPGPHKTYDDPRIPGSHKPFTVRSTDGGKTWGEPKVIPLTPFTRLTAVSSPARLMSDGRLLLPVYGHHKDQPKSYSSVVLLESRDMGRSWSTLAEITSRIGYPLREPDLVELPTGELFMVMRPVMTWSRSTDGGKTWSDARMLGRGVRILKGRIAGADKIRSAPGVLGIQGDAPYLLLTSKNILLCGIRYCPWSSTCVIHSADFGRTWSKPVVIDRVPGAYPSMVELPDGRILVVYYTEGKEDDIRCRYLRADKSGVRVVDCR